MKNTVWKNQSTTQRVVLWDLEQGNLETFGVQYVLWVCKALQLICAERHICSGDVEAKNPLEAECGPSDRYHRHPRCKSGLSGWGSPQGFAWHQLYASRTRSLGTLHWDYWDLAFKTVSIYQESWKRKRLSECPPKHWNHQNWFYEWR